MVEHAEMAWLVNARARRTAPDVSVTRFFSEAIAGEVKRFHQGFPRYRPTPLIQLKQLSRQLGISKIWIKDESYRFGLKAFKVLGASYALACIMAEKAGMKDGAASFEAFTDTGKNRLRAGLTFVTATDGNHGRAVAWAAGMLGCGAVVYMPEGSSRARVEAVKSHGARVVVVEGNYDDAVVLAARQAEEKSWILVQDTTMEGYESVPIRIMQGYLTVLSESLDALRGERPTHIFIQCGVGSFAAAQQAYLVERFGSKRPLFGVVEASKAACFYKSMSINDGKPHGVSGKLDTVMAGLACGQPSPLAWEILRAFADFFLACEDDMTMRGMRALGRPLPGDPRIVSGESGAITTGMVSTILTQARWRPAAEALKLHSKSKILLVNTEGDTDPETYHHILGSSSNAMHPGDALSSDAGPSHKKGGGSCHCMI